MNNSFLNYYKEILEKVSFDPQLLNKEYQKACTFLRAHEATDLTQWMRARGYTSFLNQSANEKHNLRQNHQSGRSSEHL